MAKATITFEDGAEGPKVSVVFIPPLQRGADLTDAQELAMQVAQSLADHPDRETITVKGSN